MIIVKHGCGWHASIAEWEHLPLDSEAVRVTDSFSVPTRMCPVCKSTITCAALEYGGEESTDAFLERMEQCRRLVLLTRRVGDGGES